MIAPKVTVLIPAYNSERWLGMTINSVLGQTFDDFELIVVDDGSSDGTKSVAEGSKDRRVRCIRQENRGLSAARNTGIRAARGQYVALLDADDLFKPKKLSKQVAALDREPDIGVVTCGYELIDERGRPLRRELPWLSAPKIDFRTILFWNPMLPSTLLLRRTWLVRIGLFDESLRRYEDWDLAIRLALAGCRMAWVPEVLLCYRRYAGNMSTRPELVPVATEAAHGFMTQLFQRSDLTPEVRALEGRAFGNLYLDAAARAFGAGLGDLARNWVQAAVRYDPELTEGNPPKWVIAMSGHALGTLVEDWRQFLHNVADNLPQTAEFKDWNVRRLTTHFFAARAFKMKQSGQRLPARLSALRAIGRDPRLLRNRGLASISIRPW